MSIKAPFGFVTGCHAGDRFMVQATLASMRHYCPEVPICLIVDGDFDVSELKREYDLLILRIPDLPCAEMKNLIAGNYRAKLAAMWEGPFEFYVWMDSDAIVWGDFTHEVQCDLDFQIFWSEISIPSDAAEVPSWLPHYYFDPAYLGRFDPSFDWRGHAYFCAGVYACRRNAISYMQWAEAESWNNKIGGGLFQFGDMGILNYLVHSLTANGLLNVKRTDLQHLWVHHGREELMEDCRGAGWHFPAEIARPRVAHFCGRKPWTLDLKAYSRPFTIARLEHHRRNHSELGSRLSVLSEDVAILARKIVK